MSSTSISPVRPLDLSGGYDGRKTAGDPQRGVPLPGRDPDRGRAACGGRKRTEGEALVRFFRKGYTEPTVIHLAKEDRIFTLVFNPFLPAMTVYEKYVDFSFNEDELVPGF